VKRALICAIFTVIFLYDILLYFYFYILLLTFGFKTFAPMIHIVLTCFHQL